MNEPVIGQPYPLEHNPPLPSGSRCVACDRILSREAQLIKGEASGLELSLCSHCAVFVNPRHGYLSHAVVDAADGFVGVTLDEYEAAGYIDPDDHKELVL